MYMYLPVHAPVLLDDLKIRKRGSRGEFKVAKIFIIISPRPLKNAKGTKKKIFDSTRSVIEYVHLVPKRAMCEWSG